MKNRLIKMMAILVINVLIIVALLGCSPTETTTVENTPAKSTPAETVPAGFTVTDIAGRTVEFSSPAEKLLILFGPGYEKVFMLGAEDRIVACADYHKTHAAWAHVIYNRLDSLTAISNPSVPNVETLLGYEPDVVFWFGNNENVSAMENAGLNVICSAGSTSTTLEALKDGLMIYAQVLGSDAISKAEEYNAYFDKILDYVTGITSKIGENEKPKVYVTSGIPLRTRGGNSIMRDTVEKAGGIYVAKDAAQGSSVINYEQMMQWNPDIIIIDHAPDLPDPSASATSNTPRGYEVYEDIMNDPQLQAINAVKNHQVYVSPTGAFFWDSGQQGILQLAWMAKVFHPDKFESLDMKAELTEFYSKFFYYDLTDEEATLILEHQLPPGAEKWGY